MKKTIECSFDGACLLNPGGALGLGAVIASGGHIEKYAGFHPAQPGNSSNVAEYMAFSWILSRLLEKDLQGEQVIIQGDSQLVIQQMTGRKEIKDGLYRKYALHALEQTKSFLNLSLLWVPREANAAADKLSKRGLYKGLKAQNKHK